MRLDRLTFTALGGIAVFLIGTALLLEDGRALFAPVFGMVGGIAAVASANHERLRERVEALEKRLAQQEWRNGIRSGAAHRGSGAHRLRRARRRS
jgi:hypothetical protein